MAGYLADKVTGSGPQTVIQHYDAAVEILEWGTHDAWQDVPTAEKGEKKESEAAPATESPATTEAVAASS